MGRQMFETEAAWIWHDDAACAFSDPEMFTVALEGQPRTKGMSREGIIKLNYDNFNAANELCLKCPVLDACLASSTEDDLTHTFRAGRVPKIYKGGRVRGGGHPAYTPDATALRKGKSDACPAGHVNMWFTSELPSGRSKRQCRECNRVKVKQWRSRQAGKLAS